MRGKTSAKDLLFDSEIERTPRRNNSQRKKRKQLAKQKKLQEGTSVSISSTSSVSEEMTEKFHLRALLCPATKRSQTN
jgi:hypothetical protein